MAFEEDDLPYILPEKLPSEKRFAVFDFTDLFNEGVTIASISENSVEVYGGNPDVSAASIKSGSEASNGMKRSQLYVGGLPGTSYLLKMRALGSDGSEEEIRLVLPVVSQRLG